MRKRENPEMQEALYKMFERMSRVMSQKLFDFGDERAIFNRGCRFTHNLEEDSYELYHLSGPNDLYPVMSDGEVDVILEKGFERGTAILQYQRTQAEIERISRNKAKAIEENNTSQARKLSKARSRLVSKQLDIKKFLDLTKI